MEKLILNVLNHITTSSHSERPRLSKSDLKTLISAFDCYYLGTGFRVMTQNYEPSIYPESWSLEEASALSGCIDCLPIGYPFPLMIYRATIEGLDVEVFLKNVEKSLKREDELLLWKTARSISQQEKEILGGTVGKVILIRAESLENF